MKALLIATVLTAAVFTSANAQEAVNDLPAAKATMTKADKEAVKAKKEADLVEAFTKAGLTTDEQTKCRAILDESNEKTKPIKANPDDTEAGKKEKLDVIYKDRNDALKAVMGDAKYKIFKATQKAQKEAASTKD